MDKQMIPLASIRIDGGTQIRMEIRTDVVQEYAEQIEKLPPVTVYFDGNHYWLADGFHRYHAARLAGASMIEADVCEGALEDARWFAASANKGHGLRRTNRDKHNAAVEALKMRPQLSDRAIAEHVGVGRSMIAAIRSQLASTGRIGQSAQRLGLDNRAYNTANIGKSATAEAALPDSQTDSDTAVAPPQETTDQKPQGRRPSEGRASSPLDDYPAIKALLKRLYDLSCYRDEQLSALAVREIAKQLTLELTKVL